MRKYWASATIAVVLMGTPAIGQSPGKSPYSAASTPIGTLLADPAARSAIAKRFPDLLRSKAVASGMANRMTLQMLKRFKPAIFTDAALAAIDADFARSPGR